MIFRTPFRLAEPLTLMLPTLLLASVVSISALGSKVRFPLTEKLAPAATVIFPLSVKDSFMPRLPTCTLIFP